MQELQALFKWIIMVFMVSLLMRPYLRIKNLELWDRGFSLSFGLGCAITFFFCWIGSALGIAKYDTPWIYIGTGIVVIGGIIISTKSVKNKITPLLKTNLKSDFPRFLLGFLLFLLIFCIGIYIKGFKSAITNSTEQYMDYGFIKAIYRQKTAFPEDIWYMGEPLNYYFLGQAATVFLCRLSFVGPQYGYPFMLYTVAASLFTMVLSLTYALIRGKRFSRIIGGLAASFMSCFAGNGHYVIYGIIVPLYEKITGNTSLRYAEYGYYFPDSTTYIGYNQVIEDYGKHEYPAYSYILGDLHAHVINLLFVIPLLALLFDYAFEESELTYKVNANNGKFSYKNIISDIFDLRLILISALFALFMGSNYWDFPIYLITCGGVILFSDYHKYKDIKLASIKTILKGIYMLAVAYILSAPFNLKFNKMASRICLCNNHSPLYKLLILWLAPVGISVWFLIYLLRNYSGKRFTVIMLAFILCALGLILVPELIYVKDIYGEAYARFNTMFKLTYQAFVLTSIVIGTAVGTWFNDKKSYRGVILLVAVLILSSYTCTGIRQFMGNIFDFDNRKSCNCYESTFDNPELDPQKNAIEIINGDKRESIHILEAGGTSYQPDNTISVFTGASTYVGWGVHEWMWRNGWEPIGKRLGEVAFFYNSGDFDYCSQFISDNNIDYIWVGPREYYYYDVDLSGFDNLPGVREVYSSEDSAFRLYAVDNTVLNRNYN